MKRAALGVALAVAVSGCASSAKVTGPGLRACPAPQVGTSSWKTVPQDLFTFRLPPGFRELPIHGAHNSWVRRFESADSSAFLSFDWGYFSDSLTNRSAGEYQQFSSCDEKIGGRMARVVALYPESPESLLFGAGAAWRSVQPGIHLTLYGWSRDRKGLDQLLRIFRTVRFKK